MNKFTSENWNHCQYKNADLTAIISFGASPGILDDSFNYYLTVLDQENNEVFQEEFNNIDAACLKINNKYAQYWSFNDLSIKDSSSGCDSCAAH